MIRSTAVLVAVLSVGGVNGLHAQESSPGPGTVEITVIPGGATFFTGGDHGASGLSARTSEVHAEEPFELPLRNVKLAEFVGGLDGFRGVYVRDQAPGQLEGGVHLRNELPAFSCRGRREVG